jgi:hypothetical protein
LPAQKGKKIPLIFNVSPQTKPTKDMKRLPDFFFSSKLARNYPQQQLFGFTSDHAYFVCGGQWDNSVLFVKLNGMLETRIVEHKDIVSCIAIEGNSRFQSINYEAENESN